MGKKIARKGTERKITEEALASTLLELTLSRSQWNRANYSVRSRTSSNHQRHAYPFAFSKFGADLARANSAFCELSDNIILVPPSTLGGEKLV